MSNQTAVALLRTQFESAHNWIEGTMADVTADVANWVPPGKPATIGANYVHHAFGEDALINMALRGGAPPLAATTFAGRTGSDTPPPPDGQWGDWGRTVQVDPEVARSYAQAVYANTDAYLASLTDEDLVKDVDMSMIGVGTIPLGRFLGGMLLLDAGAHCGEISCLKGLQGLRGYPF